MIWRKIKNSLLVTIRAAFYLVFYEPQFRFKMLCHQSRFSQIKVQIKDVVFNMIVDLHDAGLSRDLFTCRIREYPNVLYLIDFLKKYREKIEIPIDIGANIGYYVLLVNKTLAKDQARKSLALAIEPVKSSFGLLQKNIALNGFKNIRAVNVAIGEADKKVIMAVPQSKNLSHVKGVVKTIKAIKAYQQELVEMLSLKKLFAIYKIPPQKVLFRFDIEGYEYQLLKGNKDFFQKLKTAFMVMEFHPFLLKPSETIHFLKLLKEVGFRLEQVVSCYPLYFLCVPGFLRAFLKKTWVWEKENDALGKVDRLRTIDDLLAEVGNRRSPLYNHPNLHLYLVKDD